MALMCSGDFRYVNDIFDIYVIRGYSKGRLGDLKVVFRDLRNFLVCSSSPRFDPFVETLSYVLSRNSKECLLVRGVMLI